MPSSIARVSKRVRPWRSPGLTAIILVSSGSGASIVVVIIPSVCSLSRLVCTVLVLSLLSGGSGVGSTRWIFYAVFLGIAVVVHLVVRRGRVTVVDIAVGVGIGGGVGYDIYVWTVVSHSAEIVVVMIVLNLRLRVPVFLEVDFVLFILTACTTTHEEGGHRNEDSETDQTNDGENGGYGSLV